MNLTDLFASHKIDIATAKIANDDAGRIVVGGKALSSMLPSGSKLYARGSADGAFAVRYSTNCGGLETLEIHSPDGRVIAEECPLRASDACHKEDAFRMREKLLGIASETRGVWTP